MKKEIFRRRLHKENEISAELLNGNIILNSSVTNVTKMDEIVLKYHL